MSKVNKIRIAVIAIAVLSTVIGIYRGEVNEIFRKATEICYSCIGIG